MYHNGDKVNKSDIIAHVVDFFYHSVMKELSRVWHLIGTLFDLRKAEQYYPSMRY